MRLFIGTEDQNEIRAAATWAQRTGIVDVLHRSMYVVLTWWARGDDEVEVVPRSDLYDWLGATVMEWRGRPDSDVLAILRKRMASRGIWLVVREQQATQNDASVRALCRGFRKRGRA